MGGRALVSVVIPTKNSEKNIASCLISIRSQTYPHLEVIIVDDYSSDNTVKIAKRFEARVIKARAIRSRARNIGAERSKGNFILSVDSDMELEPDVVEKCVREALNGAEAVIIPEVSVGESFWARCKCFERKLFLGEKLFEGPRFFKRSVFWNLGGYDPNLEAGEDFDLSQRAREKGVRIKRINSIIKHREADFNLLKTVKREYHYAKTFYDYVSKHPQFVKQQSILFWKILARKRRELAKNLIHTMGIAIIKLFEGGAHILGFFTGKPSYYELTQNNATYTNLHSVSKNKQKN
ncbi:MAG: glycosyltransferase [Candidatus Jordarchaeum sp.]|uniref:glycosyltransferase n=1 Tax=Candidatus Jordarchaeum sp. TaxID=2823881 RepID=UPI004049DA54